MAFSLAGFVLLLALFAGAAVEAASLNYRVSDDHSAACYGYAWVEEGRFNHRHNVAFRIF